MYTRANDANLLINEYTPRVDAASRIYFGYFMIAYLTRGHLRSELLGSFDSVPAIRTLRQTERDPVVQVALSPATRKSTEIRNTSRIGFSIWLPMTEQVLQKFRVVIDNGRIDFRSATCPSLL